MTRSRFVYGLPIVALAVLLTACTPGGDPPPPGSTEPASAAPGDSAAPSPSPEGRPERDALALGPDGMGTLVFGVAPPTAADSAMIVLEPGYCVEAVMGYDTGLSATDPAAALWVPIPPYRDGVFGDFGVHVEAGVLMRIDLYDGTIPTTEGIRIGDTRAAVEAAYPGATVVEEYLTDIYVVTGPAGSLQIEVARQPDDMAYWPATEVDRVSYIHAAMSGFAPFSVAASENIAGACPH